jgi:predicted deacylase
VEGFYIAGGVLAAWALIVTAIGVTREDFPRTPGATHIDRTSVGYVTLDPASATDLDQAFAIEAKAKGDEEKMGQALRRLQEEDPTIDFHRDEQTGEQLLGGLSQAPDRLLEAEAAEMLRDFFKNSRQTPK